MHSVFLPTPARPALVGARDARTGTPLWMTETGWDADPARATLFEDEAIAELALLRAMGQPDRVSDAALIEARRGPAGPLPLGGVAVPA